MSIPANKKITFVTGKGGVGKTTVAAGLALAIAERNEKTLLIEFSDGAAGARLFAPGDKSVERVVVRLDEAVTQAAARLFGSSLLARLALQNFAVKPLVAATPALRELAVMEVIRALAAEEPRRHLVVDLPATGHGLAWLKVPRQGVELLKRGPLYDLCLGICRELLDPQHCAVWVVSLAEPLVLRETAQLCTQLREEVRLPVSQLVINRAQPVVPASVLRETRERAGDGDAYGRACSAFLAGLEAQQRAAEAWKFTVANDLEPHVGRISSLLLAHHDPTASEVAAQLRLEGAC